MLQLENVTLLTSVCRIWYEGLEFLRLPDKQWEVTAVDEIAALMS